jgi:L-asparaginase/Glu-tRNA(Gln) amidotransferase subunit D
MASYDVVPIKPRADSARSVLIINTGGTIGMSADAGGALRCRDGYLSERLLAMAEFQRPEMPSCSLHEMLPLLDSSDMCPDDWARIARVIEAEYWRYDGFVIVMGTDTMAYAASALSFMLESLGKPVIFTGSMLPLADLVNDAHRNLIVSVVIAGMLEVPEVCVFMDARLLRGNRTVKTSSEGLDSFDSPNCPPLATLETGIRLRTSLVLPPPKGRFAVHTAMEKNIAVWRMIPGFSDEYIEIIVEHSKHLRAIVLELCVCARVRAAAAASGFFLFPASLTPIPPPAPLLTRAATARATFRRASRASSTRCGAPWTAASSSSPCRSACAAAST